MDNFNTHRGSRGGQRDAGNRDSNRDSGNPGYDDSNSGREGYNERTSQRDESHRSEGRPQQTDDFGRQFPGESRQTAQGIRGVTGEWNRDEPTWHDDREDQGSRGQQGGSYGGQQSRGGSSSRGDNNRNDRDQSRGQHRDGMTQQHGGSYQPSRSNGNGERDSGMGWGQERGQNQRGERAYSYQGGHPTSGNDILSLHGPYTGKGPKGYKRSDEQICDEANQRLERNGHVDASEVEVTCTGGMVTLRGLVADRRAKREAEDCVEDIYGVQDVMNELKVDQGFFAKLFNLDADDTTTSPKNQHKKS